MRRPQVPPGTRDARTGAYIRKPVRVTGADRKKPGLLARLTLHRRKGERP